MRDLLNEIAQTMSHNKLRTALTGLSVSWGVFMLIVLLSIARGVTNNFEYMMSSGSQSNLQLWGGMTSRPYRGNREGRSINLKASDMKAIEENVPGYVEGVNAVIGSSWGRVSTNTTSINVSPSGVYPVWLRNRGVRSTTSGRNITDHDLATRAKVMVLADDYARQLFPPDGAAAVGSRVNFAGLSFLIVGTYSHRWERRVLIPYTTALMMAKDKDQVGSITVNLKNVTTEAQGEEAEAEVRASVAKTQNFDPDDSGALWIRNSFLDAVRGGKAMSILSIAVWILGTLTLLTGIVGISNIMFVSVRERTHEIGIRRAIGAKPRAILTQILAESVAITVLFGYVGIVLGTLVAQIISMGIGDEMMRDATVNLAICFEVTAVLVLAGALAGLFPALRALKVKPVEALRDE